MMFSVVFLHGLLLLSPSTVAAWLVPTITTTTTSARRLSHFSPPPPPPSGRAPQEEATSCWPRRTSHRGEAAAVEVDSSRQLAPDDLLLDERRVKEEEVGIPERLPPANNNVATTISVVEKLQRRLLLSNQNSSSTATTTRGRLVQVEGYVTAKRAFGSSFCFLDLVPAQQAQQHQEQQQQQQPVQAMLKRQEFDHGSKSNSSSSFFDGYMKSIVPGIRLGLVGHVVSTRNNAEALLSIRDMRILDIPRNPQHVRILLNAVADHQLDALELVQAIQAACSPVIPAATTAAAVLPTTAATTATTTDATNNMSWWSTAAQLVQTLQQEKRAQSTNSRIENKQPYYRLAKEIVAHLRPLQQQQQGIKAAAEERDLVMTSLEQSLASGKKHDSRLLPVAGSDISRPPKEISSVCANAMKRQSNVALDTETTTFDSVMTLMKEQFAKNNKGEPLMMKSSSIRIRACVQNRRRFQNGITILEATDTMDASYNDHKGSAALPGDDIDMGNSRRLKCVLHPDVFKLQNTMEERNTNPTIAHVYSQLLAPGSLVLWHGFLSPSSSPSFLVRPPILWVTNVRLLRASWRPSVICYFLELFVEQQQRQQRRQQQKELAAFLEAQEVVQALGISEHELNDIVSSDLTQRQWAAAVISKNLQHGTPSVAAARMGTLDPKHMAILDSFQDLRRRHPVTAVHAYASRPEYNNNNNQSSTSTLDERTGSRWKRKKEPQLEWMTEQVRSVVQSHPDYGTRPLRILDVGGGKGLLANRLAAALGGKITNSSVEIQVIDIAQGAIKNGAMRSKRLALPVQYSVQDASTARIKGEIDVVVALHACGTLSDVALEQAVAHEAGFVICPCCFRSNLHLQILPRSQNGQPISVQKWLGVQDDDAPHDDWDALTSLAEVQGDIELSQRAMHTICALRAAAFHRHSAETNKKRPNVHADIKTFPMAFSTRNVCLVGTFS